MKICLHSGSIEFNSIRCLLYFLDDKFLEFLELTIAHLIPLSYAWENIFYNWCWESLISHYFHFYFIVGCCAFILVDSFFRLGWVYDVKNKGGASFEPWSFVQVAVYQYPNEALLNFFIFNGMCDKIVKECLERKPFFNSFRTDIVSISC